MYTRRNYGFWMTFNWSKKPFMYGFMYAAVLAMLYYFLKIHHSVDISLPWQPISVLGIAVAFYLGFKNNSSYDRTWEARKIWGGIVNNSRTFGVAVCTFVQGDDIENVRKRLIYRHLAWLTALRYQLRLSREWEHTESRLNGLYSPDICEAYFDQLDGEIMNFIPKEELKIYRTKANMAAQVLLTQAKDIQDLYQKGYFDAYKHVELHRLVGTFYDDQGKSERIKNFPFPRQYASVALWQTLIFAILIPLGMLDIFVDAKSYMFWISVPFSALIIWVFFLMEKIGDYSENPFEGTYNDVPITSIARSIEIDLRQMINDTEIPAPLAASNGFLM